MLTLNTLLFIIGVSILVELFLLFGKFSRTAKIVFAGISILASTFASSLMVIFYPSIASFILLLLVLPRVVSVARIVESRMHSKELLAKSIRTLAVDSTCSSLLACYLVFFDDTTAVSVFLLLQLQLLVATLLFLSVFITRYIYRFRPSNVLPEKLPTVTVCIPARNETQDLPACVESVIASTYPKLEILVLDDCSHDKTPEIIKGYAHAGVRFINGKEPRDDWLAKNAAYDRLADEAQGNILIFLGVDVRLKPDSIMQLVSQMDNKDMISVLPRRAPQSEAAFFIQPIRYWWELGLWRFALRQPPVLSTLWVIRAETLKKLGTFESIKKAVEPEAVLAKKLAKDNNYSFLIANDSVGVVSIKRPKDQYQTALRKRYPQVRRRPETALLVMLFELIFVLLPYLFTLWFLLQDYDAAAALSLVTIVLLSFANAEVHKLSLRRLWPLGFISVPTQVVADWALMLQSMYAYEFGQVVWKERNICLPLLKVEKSLPRIDK